MPDWGSSETRRTIKRERRNPKRFVAGASNSVSEAEVGINKKEVTKSPNLRLSDDLYGKLLHKQVQVCLSPDKSSKWLTGLVNMFLPESKTYKVKFERGDDLVGRFEDDFFVEENTLSKYKYQWLAEDCVNSFSEANSENMSSPSRDIVKTPSSEEILAVSSHERSPIANENRQGSKTPQNNFKSKSKSLVLETCGNNFNSKKRKSLQFTNASMPKKSSKNIDLLSNNESKSLPSPLKGNIVGDVKSVTINHNDQQIEVEQSNTDCGNPGVTLEVLNESTSIDHRNAGSDKSFELEAKETTDKVSRNNSNSLVKNKKTTNISGATLLQIHPLPLSESSFPIKSSPEANIPSQSKAETLLLEDEIEAEIVCTQLLKQLCVLTRARDSIAKATAIAIASASVNAAPRVIRLIADQMEKIETLSKRIDMFYLVDSILQGCQRSGRPNCGPGSAASVSFPRVIAAALPRFINALCVSLEGVQKALKVLNIWDSRRLVQQSILQLQIERLQLAQTNFEEINSKPTAIAIPKDLSHVDTARCRSTSSNTIQLVMQPGEASMSAELEDQYGTKELFGDVKVVRREDSDSDDSDDEINEYERKLRAKYDNAEDSSNLSCANDDSSINKNKVAQTSSGPAKIVGLDTFANSSKYDSKFPSVSQAHAPAQNFADTEKDFLKPESSCTFLSTNLITSNGNFEDENLINPPLPAEDWMSVDNASLLEDAPPLPTDPPLPDDPPPPPPVLPAPIVLTPPAPPVLPAPVHLPIYGTGCVPMWGAPVVYNVFPRPPLVVQKAPVSAPFPPYPTNMPPQYP